MEQALAFYDNMKNLEAQGVPVDWSRVAQTMATALRAVAPSPQLQPLVSEDP